MAFNFSDLFRIIRGGFSAPEVLLYPEIQGLAYVDAVVTIDVGEWLNADSFEVKIVSTEGDILLDWTASPGNYIWTIPTAAAGKTLAPPLVKAIHGDVSTTVSGQSEFGPIDALAVVYDTGNISSATASSSATLTWTHTVREAQNNILFVALGFYGGGTNTISSVTFDGQAMTLVTGTGAQSPSSRGVNVSLWQLQDPPTGTAQTILATASGSPSRFYGCAVVAEDVDTTLVATATPYWSGTAATSYSNSTPASATQIYQSSLVVAGSYRSGTSPVVSLTGGYTEMEYITVTGAEQYLLVGEAEAAGSEVMANGTSITSTGNRSQAIIQIILQPVPHIDTPPIYYVANTGDDNNDGLTYATAWKSLDRVQSISPLAPGTEIVFEDGEYHRYDTRPASTDFALDVTCNGLSVAPVKLRTRNGGRAYIAGDEVMSGWAAATAGETNSTAVSLGAEKITLGDFATWPQLSFACGDDQMCQPATWSASGYPSSIYDWELSVDGSDSYSFVDPSDIQPSEPPPAAFDATKTIQCKAVYVSGTGDNAIYTWTVRIADPAIGTHYGATSPVGAFLIFKSANIQARYETVSAYDEAGSWIECEYTGASNRGPAGVATNNYWTVLGHPFDLRKEGQFARIGDDIFAIFPSGTTTKSVVGVTKTARVRGTYAEVSNLEICRCAADSGDGLESTFEIGGTGHTLTDVGSTQAINPGRPAAFGVVQSATPLSESTITRPYTRLSFTNSGFRLNNVYGAGYSEANVTITRPDLQELGRTGMYFGGSTSGVTVVDMLLPQHSAVHGNGITSYQSSNHCTINGAAATDTPIALTSQNKFVSIADKANDMSCLFFVAQRAIGPSPATRPANTPLMRMDEGDTNSQFSKVVAYGSASASWSWDGYPDYNTGASISRAALQSLALSETNGHKAGQGMTLTNVLANESIAFGTGASGTYPWDTYGGATISNSTVDTSATVYPMSSNMWEHYTNTGSGYAATQVGPSTWNFTIPAYGSAITMQSVSLFSPTIRNGWQAYRSVGTIVGVMPGTSISLPAGVTDNDDFELDVAFLVPKVSLATGTYTVTIRQTNASATNGPIFNNTITIEVVP